MDVAALSLPSPPFPACRWRPRLPRAAIVQAPPVPAGGNGTARGGQYPVLLPAAVSSASLSVVRRDRAEDMQAEARAMGRAANATIYSPELLAAKYSSRPFKLVSRTVEIFTALGAFAFKLLLDQRQGQFDQRKRQRAAELTKTLTQLGPTFVKIGQGLSTRPDICPPEYLDELSELQDALPTFPDETAFACIESELGVSLDSIYSAISPEPIAAASLGQVYKAQLKQTGQFVAVKVQRPGIEEAIGLDFYLLRGLGFLVNKYVDFISSDVVALIDEFAKRVYQELNYVQEGKNARRFRKLYADKEEVYVPDIYWDYTSAKVLTMDWVDGVKLNEQEAIEKRGLKMLNLVDIGIQCSLRQLLEYGYFHADPHPGNLLATPEGKLAFIDFGMMSETPEEARSAIIGHVVHMVNRDYNAMARDYYALNFLTSDVDVSPIVPALKNFFDGALNSTVSELNFKTIVDGLGNVLYQYPFNVPAYYALILRSLTVLEANRWNRLENLLVQGQKDRDFTTKDALQPVLKLLLGPDGEELRGLVVQEAVRVTEAIVLGSMIDTYDSMPDFMKVVVNNGNTNGPFKLSDGEQARMLELRDRVLRVWSLLRSSDSFDPSLLQPLVQVLEEREARNLGGRIFGGVTQRLSARLLQQVLRSPTTVSAAALQ
ncbi:hypothetical protein ZIOFF_045623 [Zingiber officinale]|uniref:Protein kinase domain-containing protein n=1 Tax=Zingiber officinale TaxID=94328 RepID=A0A8J5G800_ZINOF|nr:hypothetical protein ZIOFF_045623 [Zingiber officinale]